MLISYTVLGFRDSSKGDLFREILKPAPELDADKADVLNTADIEHTTLDLIVDNHITDSEFKVSERQSLVVLFSDPWT